MDFAKVSVQDLRNEARRAGIDETGATGRTSWVATATRAEMERALAAHANGTPLVADEDAQGEGEGAQGSQGEQGEGDSRHEKKLRKIAREEAERIMRRQREAKRTVVVKQDAEGKESERLDVGVTHKVFPDVLALLRAGLHVYLYGPPGVGKTHLCEQLAKALACEFHADSFTPHTSDWRVSGYKSTTTGDFIATPFHAAVIGGGLYLGDEIDKASDGVVGTFNLAMSQSVASFACGLVAKHPNTRLVFAGNTVGLGATPMYPDRSVLPADFRDRLVFVEMPVDETLERSLALARNADAGAWVDYVQATRKEVTKQGLPLVVSPRASMNGATLLALGWNMTQVADAMLWRGAPDSMVRRAKGERS